MFNKILWILIIIVTKKVEPIAKNNFKVCSKLYQQSMNHIYSVINDFHENKYDYNPKKISNLINSVYEIASECHGKKKDIYFECSKGIFTDLYSLQRIIKGLYEKQYIKASGYFGSLITDVAQNYFDCKGKKEKIIDN